MTFSLSVENNSQSNNVNNNNNSINKALTPKKRRTAFRGITSLLLVTFMMTGTVVPQDTPDFVSDPGAVSQRGIRNSSIEKTHFPVAGPPGGPRGVIIVPDAHVPGWFTTHPVITHQGTTPASRAMKPIERWASGFINNGTWYPAIGAGQRWVELGAFDRSMLYQRICLQNNEEFTWSFLHRGRTGTDTMMFRIGIPEGLVTGSTPRPEPINFRIATVSTSQAGNGTIDQYDIPNSTIAPTVTRVGTTPVAPVATSPGRVIGGWGRYAGKYKYTGPTQVVSMGFLAVASAGGLAEGNLVDHFRIGLPAQIEMGDESGSEVEQTTPGGSVTPAERNRPRIRVGGVLTEDVVITVRVVSGTATAGTDYSLTSTFEPGNTTDTVTVTIPAGEYDGEDDIFPTPHPDDALPSSIFRVPFSVNPDTSIEPHETINFKLEPPVGVTIGSIKRCGRVVLNTGYTILNDDRLVSSANVEVSGLVVDHSGRPRMNAKLTLTSQDGRTHTATTNPFGYFTFKEIPSGQTYVLRTSVRGLSFEPQTFSITDNLPGLHITPITP